MIISEERIDNLRKRYSNSTQATKVSFVCVYNNTKILEKDLLSSLKIQDHPWELITIDNTSKKFSSAASALNFGAEIISGDYIIFCHQDIEIHDSVWIKKALDMISELQINKSSIAGVAGRNHVSKKIVTNIDRSLKESPLEANHIDKPVEVDTVDCCMIIIPSHIFKIIKFDEETCSDWHLYTEDYCLSAKNLGYGVYVLPLYLIHNSSGININLSFNTSTKGYYSTLEKVIKKHKKIKRIYTTTKIWNTRENILLQKIKVYIYYLIHQSIKYIWRKLHLKKIYRYFHKQTQ